MHVSHGGYLFMHTISITDRLEAAAALGKTSISLFVWKSTVNRLSKQGIIFTKEFNYRRERKGEAYYLISWDHAVVNDLPENWTVESITRSRSLSQGQYLWLVAQDYNRRKPA